MVISVPSGQRIFEVGGVPGGLANTQMLADVVVRALEERDVEVRT
jgi:hypothetical protein